MDENMVQPEPPGRMQILNVSLTPGDGRDPLKRGNKRDDAAG